MARRFLAVRQVDEIPTTASEPFHHPVQRVTRCHKVPSTTRSTLPLSILARYTPSHPPSRRIPLNRGQEADVDPVAQHRGLHTTPGKRFEALGLQQRVRHGASDRDGACVVRGQGVELKSSLWGMRLKSSLWRRGPCEWKLFLSPGNLPANVNRKIVMYKSLSSCSGYICLH